MKAGQEVSGAKKLVVMLVFLFIIASVLIASIVIVVKNKDANQSDGNNEESTIVDSDAEDDSENDISNYIREMDRKISEAKTSEEKINLYQERIDHISANTAFGEYKDQIINDTIVIDDLEQSITSAGQVINTASSYGAEDIVKKYQAIMKQRMADEGINNEGVQGIG